MRVCAYQRRNMECPSESASESAPPACASAGVSDASSRASADHRRRCALSHRPAGQSAGSVLRDSVAERLRRSSAPLVAPGDRLSPSPAGDSVSRAPLPLAVAAQPCEKDRPGAARTH